MSRAVVTFAVLAILLMHGYQCASGLLTLTPSVPNANANAAVVVAIESASLPHSTNDESTASSTGSEPDQSAAISSCISQTTASATKPAPQVAARALVQHHEPVMQREPTRSTHAVALSLSQLCVLRT